MKTIFFLRHGKTEYTGNFPDLTDTGKEEIRSSAEELHRLITKKPNKTVRIISSPAPRALGSADIIASKLGNGIKVEKEDAIRCMDFYNEKQANMIWTKFGTARDVDRAYATHPTFESGIAIERRSSIQARFEGFLQRLFLESHTIDCPDFTICTSHFEILWKLASMTRRHRTEPLSHGELIRMSVRPNDDSVSVVVEFRGDILEMSSINAHELMN